jgi:hypothetical protein
MARRAVALITILQVLATSCGFGVFARVSTFRVSAMSARRSGRLASLQAATLTATVAIDQPAAKRSAPKASETAQTKKPRKTAAGVSTESVVLKRNKKAVAATATVATTTEGATPKRAPPVREPILRATTARAAPLALHEPHLRLLSWNVNGIRALLRKDDAKLAFKSIIDRERPHCLLLQETKVRRTRLRA